MGVSSSDNAAIRAAEKALAPLESAPYTSIDYTQTLDGHGVLASVGSVGDPYDNSLAESFVDNFKGEPCTVTSSGQGFLIDDVGVKRIGG